MVFVTLFDSNYLDRGLVLYESLERCTDDYKLYVIAFDDKCYEILKNEKRKNLIPIKMEDFENEELLSVKSTRARSEYCWTCSSFAIAYVLDHYEDECTYIDADMFFYKNPNYLFEEMQKNDCDVQIIEHRFDNRVISRQMMKRAGKYCVQFNSFLNTSNSRMILRWWQDRVIESCSVEAKKTSFGDQKYLDEWTEKFNNVHVVEDLGAGVAPWNITNYELISSDELSYKLKYKTNNKICDLVFYHFHNLQFVTNDTVDIEVYNRALHTSERLVEAIYLPYINKLLKMRRYLKLRYDLCFYIKKHKSTSIVSLLKNKSSIFSKFYGYSLVGIFEYLIYQKNRKKDIIEINIIEEE